jgi:pimeloyl-ACP methyl ester carboxylesterase
VNFEERYIDVVGATTRYLTAGTTGPPLVLLHGVGDNALDWQWALPSLAGTHRVYAPDLPGSGGSAKPKADYSPAFFTDFLSAFLDAVEVERAAVLGNSLGGLVGLRLAMSEPERVTALGLVSSAGLGREVTYALRSLNLPGYGRLAVAWGKRPPGAAQRALGRATLLFARPKGHPLEVAQGAVQAGEVAGFRGGPASRRSRPSRSRGTARGVDGSAREAGDADAHRMGNARQGAPLLPSERGGFPSSRRVPRTHARLRAPAPRRAAPPLCGDGRPIPRPVGVSMMEVDRERLGC